MQPTPLPITSLHASKTNPRKHFDAEKLAELAGNLRQHGVLQALLVRPVWCQGCGTKAELAARRSAEHPQPGGFEVVDGERRFRAAGIAELDTLPCDVREFTDSEVIEIQLITYLLKEPLTPFEEAKGFKDLLELRGEDAKPLHTAASIAQRVNKEEGYVYKRLKLLELPEPARSALLEGRIGVAVAAMIARIPGKEQRIEAAKEIVGPGRMDGEPMTKREVERFVAERFMKELKGAPFDTADETLDAKAGSCAACPHRTGNNRALFGDVKRGDVCTNPACFAAKCTAVFTRAAAAAKAAGEQVLAGKDAEDIFDRYSGDRLRYDSPYVDFHEKPEEGIVRHEVDKKKLPTWEKLTAGRQVPVVVVQDHTGRVRRLVDRKLAIAAAKENGEEIFVTGVGQAGGGDPAGAARRKAENAAAKKEQAVAIAATNALHAKIAEKGVVAGFWEVLLESALGHAGSDGTWFLLKARGIKKGVDETTEQAFRKHLKTIAGSADEKALAAVTVELLYSRAFRFGGPEGCEDFAALAKLYKVDVPAIKAEVTAQLKAAKKPKPEKPAKVASKGAAPAGGAKKKSAPPKPKKKTGGKERSAAR